MDNNTCHSRRTCCWQWYFLLANPSDLVGFVLALATISSKVHSQDLWSHVRIRFGLRMLIEVNTTFCDHPLCRAWIARCLERRWNIVTYVWTFFPIHSSVINVLRGIAFDVVVMANNVAATPPYEASYLAVDKTVVLNRPTWHLKSDRQKRQCMCQRKQARTCSFNAWKALLEHQSERHCLRSIWQKGKYICCTWSSKYTAWFEAFCTPVPMVFLNTATTQHPQTTDHYCHNSPD